MLNSSSERADEMHDFHARVLTVDPERLPETQAVMIVESIRRSGESVIAHLNTQWANGYDSDEVWRWWHLYLKLSTSNIYTRPF